MSTSVGLVAFVPQLPVLLFVVVLVLVLFLTDVPKSAIKYYLTKYSFGQDVTEPPPSSQSDADVLTSDEKPKLSLETETPDQSHLTDANLHVEPANNHRSPPSSDDEADVLTSDEKPKLLLKPGIPNQSHFTNANLHVDPANNHSSPPSPVDDADVLTSDEKLKLTLETETPDQTQFIPANLHVDPAKTNSSPPSSDDDADVLTSDEKLKLILDTETPDQTQFIPANLHVDPAKRHSPPTTDNQFGDCHLPEVTVSEHKDQSQYADTHGSEIGYSSDLLPIGVDGVSLIDDDSRLICRENIDECVFNATLSKEISTGVDEVDLIRSDDDSREKCLENIDECFINATLSKEILIGVHELGFINSDDGSLRTCLGNTEECVLKEILPQKTSTEVDEVGLINSDDNLLLTRLGNTEERVLKEILPQKTSTEVDEVGLINSDAKSILRCLENTEERVLKEILPEESSSEVVEVGFMNCDAQSLVSSLENTEERVLKEILPKETLTEVVEFGLKNCDGKSLLICKENIDECVIKATLPKVTSIEVNEVDLINSNDQLSLFCREIIDECVFKATLSSKVEDINLIFSEDDSLLICQEIVDDCFSRATSSKESFNVVKLEASNDTIATQSGILVSKESPTTSTDELNSSSNEDETSYALPDINDISKHLNNLVTNMVWCATNYFSKDVPPPVVSDSCPTEPSPPPQQLRSRDAYVCDESMHCAGAERWSDEDGNADEDANADECKIPVAQEDAQEDAQSTTECDSNRMESRIEGVDNNKRLECIESDINLRKSLEVVENVTKKANERENIVENDVNGFEKALKDVENAIDKVNELEQELDDIEMGMAIACHDDVTVRVTNLENALADISQSKLTVYFDSVEEAKSLLKEISDISINHTVETISSLEDTIVFEKNDVNVDNTEHNRLLVDPAEEINSDILGCDVTSATEEKVSLESLKDGSVLPESRHETFTEVKDDICYKAIENDIVVDDILVAPGYNDPIDVGEEIKIERTSETKFASLESLPDDANDSESPQVVFDHITKEEAQTSATTPTTGGNNGSVPIETSASVDGTSLRFEITPPGGPQEINGFIVKNIDVAIKTFDSSSNCAHVDLVAKEENDSRKIKPKEDNRNLVQNKTTSDPQERDESHTTESWVVIDNTTPINNQDSIGNQSSAKQHVTDDLSSMPGVNNVEENQEVISNQNIGSHIDLNDVYMSMMMEDVMYDMSSQDNASATLEEGDTYERTEKNAPLTASEFTSDAERKTLIKELSDECCAKMSASYIDDIDLRNEENENSSFENVLLSCVKAKSSFEDSSTTETDREVIVANKENAPQMAGEFTRSDTKISIKKFSDECCGKMSVSHIDDVDLRKEETENNSVENKFTSSDKAKSSFEASSSSETCREEIVMTSYIEEKQCESVSIDNNDINVSVSRDGNGPAYAVLDARISIRKRLEKFEQMSSRSDHADPSNSSNETVKTKSVHNETTGPQKYYEFSWTRSGIAEATANKQPASILKAENKDSSDMNKREHWFPSENDSERLQNVVRSKSEDLRYSHKTGRNREEVATGQAETTAPGQLLTQSRSSRRKASTEITKFWERKRGSDDPLHLSSHSSALGGTSRDSVRVFCLECFDTAEKLNAVEEELFLTEYQRVDATGSSGSGLDRHRDSVELLTAKSFDSTERRGLRDETDSGLLRHKDSFELISSKSGESSDRRNPSEQELGMFHDEEDELDNIATIKSASSGLVKHKDSVDMLCVKSFHSADRRISFGDELNVMIGEFPVDDDDELGGAGLEKHRDSVEVMAVKSRNSAEEDESHGTHAPKSILKINKTRFNSRSVSWKDLKEKISSQSSLSGETDSNMALSRSRLALERSKEHHRSILDASIFNPSTESTLEADGEDNAPREGSLIRIFSGQKAFKYSASECGEEYSSLEESSWSDVKIKSADTETENVTKSVETYDEGNTGDDIEVLAQKESSSESINVDQATLTGEEDVKTSVNEVVDNINNTVEESPPGEKAQPGPYLGVKAKSTDHTDNPNDNLTTRLIKLSEKFKCKTAHSDNELNADAMPQSVEYQFVKDKVSILERYYDRISSIKVQGSEQSEDAGNEEKTG